MEAVEKPDLIGKKCNYCNQPAEHEIITPDHLPVPICKFHFEMARFIRGLNK